MYQNILVPVVFDDQHDLSATFAIARALAGPEARFTLVHAMESIPNYAMSEVPADILVKSRENIETKLEQTAAELPNATTVLRSGHAGREIVEYAHDNGIDCIVIASSAPGLGHFFLGSTADWVVRHSRCSVHVIR